MTLPPSIANLGAPPNATPQMMAQLRAEKARQAALIEQRENQRLRSLAEYIETHPVEAVAQASAHVDRFLASPGHVRLHWALAKWKTILATWPVTRIVSLLRDNDDSTRDLRETSPFSRPDRLGA
jgi:hypothetical protein